MEEKHPLICTILDRYPGWKIPVDVLPPLKTRKRGGGDEAPRIIFWTPILYF